MTRYVLFCLFLASPDPPDTPVGAHAVRLYASGEYQECIQVLTPGDGTSRDETERRLWLARCYMKLRRWDDAIAGLERAVASEQSDCVVHLWLGRAYGRKASQAFLARAIGLAKKVRAEFEMARLQCSENTDVRFDLLTFYLEAPGFLGGGRDKAEAEAAEIARMNPRLGFTARAMIPEEGRNWDRAFQELRRAAEDFPAAEEAHRDLAAYLFRRGDFAGACASAGRALELRSQFPGAALLLAQSRIGMGDDVSGAVGLLKTLSSGPLTDEDPPFQDLYYWLGRGYMALRMKTEATQALESALRFDPGHAGARSALAQARKLP